VTPSYWVAILDGRAWLMYANTDTAATAAASFAGPFRILRCRLWAVRHGCRWPPVR